MALFESRTITATQPGPRLLITGGVHGDEFEPMAAIRRLAEELPTALMRGSVTLVPVVNVGAFRRGHRTGDDGLDLARTCPGRADGSITEQVAFELSQLIRKATHYIDLHTGGTRLKVLPLAGYILHADPLVLAAQRQMARVFGLPIVWGTDPSFNGRSLSVARDANIPAIYCEYEGGAACNPAGITAYVHGCKNILASLQMIAPVEHITSLDQIVVEDNRPGAGHMQINHPSPVEGFFEPTVALGDDVETGALLGTVVDFFGTQKHEIRAGYAGKVIVLHTFSRIDAETSVAVLLR